MQNTRTESGTATALTPRQQEIIEAAIQLISERSIQELTIKNLSARIGVTEAALYRHFASKLDILTAILDQFKQNAMTVHEEIRGLPAEPLEKIESLFLNHFRTFTRKPYLADVIFSEEIFQNDSRLSETVLFIMNLNFEILQSLLERGRRDGQIRTDMRVQEQAIIIVGSLRMLVTRWRLERFRSDLELQGAEMWKTLKKILTVS
ncbi:MAG: TetR/AcrR family transcriptional regulator [Bacteroidetes bacterium]|nr:TetR/AcrR family transcriptional regulator [Bacteroidota bacterium]